MKRLYTAALIMALATGAAQAEQAVLELGNYSTTDEILEGGSVAESGFPVNYCYTYSGGQMLYPNELVKEIADRNGKITKIEFRYKDNGTFYGSEFSTTVTLNGQGSDLQALPQAANKRVLWQEYSTASTATARADFVPAYWEEDFTIELTFDNPVALVPGQSLLLTASSASDGMVESAYDVSCYAFNGGGSTVASFFASDTKTFAEEVSGGAPNQWYGRWLPVIKITYTYEDAPAPVPCEAPVITPVSGSRFGPETEISITSATEGAKILYTLAKDGTPDIEYTAPFTLSEPKATTVTAIAVKEGCVDSDPVSATFAPEKSTMPAFKIPTGTQLGANEPVIITATPGARILYTLDATAEPDLEYPADGIVLTADATVKALAIAPGAWPGSAEQASYTVSTLDATNVGDYWAKDDEENLFIGTNWYNAPIIPTYANSASQLLYLPAELSAFTDKTRIREISFRFANQTSFSDYSSEARLYLSLIDAEEFAYDKINEKYSWFEVDLDAPVMNKSIEISFVDYYFSTGELTFELPDDGLTYVPGQALLITMVNEAPYALDNSEYPQFFKYNTDTKRAATFCSDHIDYAESLAVTDYIVSGNGYYSQMTDKNQPCLRLMTDELGTNAIRDMDVATPADADAVYYNLQGVRVSAPAAGIYIRRTPAGAEKVLVK